MKIWLLSMLIGLTVSINYAQEKVKGNRNVITVETPLSSFNSLSIGESFQVTLVKSLSPSIEIETDQNLHEFINFEVIDGQFTMNTTAKIRSKKKLDITLKYVDTLSLLKISEDAELNAVSNIESDTLAIIISDFGKVDLDISSNLFLLTQKNNLNLTIKSKLNILSEELVLNIFENSKLDAYIKSDSIQINMADNSKIELDGTSNWANINLSNSADLLGKTFTINNCQAILKDESDLTIHVTETISINSSGISETYLYGNSEIIIENFADKSKIHKKEL